jgi:two-component system response regulator FixJ
MKRRKKNLPQMNNDSRHIFFVDDELKVRQVVAETLEQLSARVTCFPCASDCLEQLSCHKCDLLITDLKLPEMDGIELLRCARLIAPWVPVLIITGYGDVPTAVEAIKAGATDFIEKPLNKKSFLRKVKSLLPENGNHKHLGTSLTQSEERVLKLVLNGRSNQEIASLFNRSRRTIEVHRANMMHKLGAESVIDLVKQAATMGLTDLGAGIYRRRNKSCIV